MRNYAVLHIVAEESRIFKTKERCPLLLCIEVYRPTEIALEPVPDALNIQRELNEKQQKPPKEVQIMIQKASEIDEEDPDPFAPRTMASTSKKEKRAATMTQSF